MKGATRPLRHYSTEWRDTVPFEGYQHEGWPLPLTTRRAGHGEAGRGGRLPAREYGAVRPHPVNYNPGRAPVGWRPSAQSIVGRRVPANVVRPSYAAGLTRSTGEVSEISGLELPDLAEA